MLRQRRATTTTTTTTTTTVIETTTTAKNNKSNKNNKKMEEHELRMTSNQQQQLQQQQEEEEQTTGSGVQVACPKGLNDVNPLPIFSWNELKMGRVIGRGGFCVVSELRSLQLDPIQDVDAASSKLRHDFVSWFSGHSFSPTHQQQQQQHGKQAVVVKMLRHDLNEEDAEKGIVDMALEIHFLQHLHHVNIIRLLAHSCTGQQHSTQQQQQEQPDQGLTSSGGKCFMLLEQLSITLERKLNFWRKEVGENMGYWMGPCIGYCCARQHILQQLWYQRFSVAHQIASAILHLHQQQIVYRDLKPDNVGFTNEGTVKIFDFGLAKRLLPQDYVQATGMYRLTGNTGSLRYMAPEVALCLTYNASVDAYSFGIMFWQLLSLTTPYIGYTTQQHADRVVRQGHRPKPDTTWPKSWTNLMTSCWSTDPKKRPNFEDIVYTLGEEMDTLSDTTTMGAADARRTKARKRQKVPTAHDAPQLNVNTRKTGMVDVIVVSDQQQNGKMTTTTTRQSDATIV